MRNKYPAAFPYGTSGVDISDLFVYIFTGKLVGKLNYNCTECGTIMTSAPVACTIVNNPSAFVDRPLCTVLRILLQCYCNCLSNLL